MIRTEEEYIAAVERVEDEAIAIEKERQRLLGLGLSEEQAEYALQPAVTFREQYLDEVEEYERLRRGQLDNSFNLMGIGRRLVQARIYRKMTQQELAEKLGITAQQVSRDERNEYHNAGIERIKKVMEALGLEMTSQFRFNEQIPA
jgi:DNA-binding XRE family transcriptional regulator